MDEHIQLSSMIDGFAFQVITLKGCAAKHHYAKFLSRPARAIFFLRQKEAS
jgi:hypothetical protein